MPNRLSPLGWCACGHGEQYHRGSPCSVPTCECASFIAGGLSLETLLSRCVEDDNGCLIYQGSIDSSGYASLAFEGKVTRGHRLAYRLKHGRWPTGHCLHSCDVPACCNPDHLRDGTPAENMRDAVVRGRHVSGFKLHAERRRESGYVTPKVICLVPGCSNVHSSRGLCSTHLARIRRGHPKAEEAAAYMRHLRP